MVFHHGLGVNSLDQTSTHNPWQHRLLQPCRKLHGFGEHNKGRVGVDFLGAKVMGDLFNKQETGDDIYSDDDKYSICTCFYVHAF